MARSNKNLVLLADGYKYSFPMFDDPTAIRKYSYLESRGGRFDEVTVFGLQYFLKEYCTGVVITEAKIKRAELILGGMFGNTDIFRPGDFRYLINKHGGKLPVEIKAVPEGLTIPNSNILLSMENTDHSTDAVWLTQYLESLLLQVWYPMSVCTISNQTQKLITKYFEKAASKESFGMIPYVMNNFGLRGSTCPEAATIADMSHLVNAHGTDCALGSEAAMDYYNTYKVYGSTIPATEHSVMTLNGEEGECDKMEDVLDAVPHKPVACVSDSFNILNACTNYWGGKLRTKILSRPNNAPIVIRPDSGEPITTLILVFEALFEAFGYTINEKGYKVLPPQVRVIQGDGVQYESIQDMYEAITNEVNKISPENLFLGQGGGLVQKDVDRDMQKFAFKNCWAVTSKGEIDVQKSPTEFNAKGEIIPSFKKSKAGRLKLIIDDGGKYKTVREDDEKWKSYKDILVPIFRNGELLIDWTFEQVMERAKI